MNKEFSVFNALLKIAPLLMGYKPQTDQGQLPTVTTFTSKDLALLSLMRKIGSVIVVLGSRDTGKTELCYRIMEFLGRPAYAVSPQQKPPDWITWLKIEELFERVPPDSTLLMDDLPAYMSNKDYQDAFVKSMEKVIPMVRHEPQPPDYPLGKIHLIFSSQSAAQADKYILDCDVAFLKPLGLLMDDMERPNIAKIYRNLVNPEFEGKDDMFIKRHAYMLSRSYRGMVEIEKTT